MVSPPDDRTENERIVLMIIYLAGQAQEARKLKNKHLFRHVLFSNYLFCKRNFRYLKKLKEKEIHAAQKGSPA